MRTLSAVGPVGVVRDGHSDPSDSSAPAPAAQPLAAMLPSLTGLRFVAALWVLAHHLSFMPLGAYERWLAPIRPILAAGPLGVDLFFVLSGMLLARTYLERWHGAPDAAAAGRYLWARLARVWPLYAVVVVGFGVWCGARAAWGRDGVVAWQSVQPSLAPSSWLAQLTMTQLWTAPDFDGVSFVLPTWSVSAEFAAYLAFPVLALVVWRMRRWPRPLLVAATTAVPAAGVVTGAAGVTDWSWVIRLAGGFVAGMLAWLVVRGIRVTPRIARRANTVVPVVVAEILLVAYWAASAPATASVPSATRLLLAVPLFPLLLGALAVSDPTRGIAGWLARPALQHGGRMSYALYLVHFPVLEVALTAMTRFPVLGPHTAAAAMLVPQLAVGSLLLAYGAHRWIEEPARHAVQRVVTRRTRPEMAVVADREVSAASAASDASRVAGALMDSPRRAGSARRGGGTGRRGGSHAARAVPARVRVAGSAPARALDTRTDTSRTASARTNGAGAVRPIRAPTTAALAVR